MNALEKHRTNNALKLSFVFLYNVNILRSYNHLYGLVFVKAVINAFKLFVLKHYFIVLNHYGINDIALAYEVCNKFVYRLVINIRRSSYLLNFAVLHNDDFIGHCKCLFLIMCYI